MFITRKRAQYLISHYHWEIADEVMEVNGWECGILTHGEAVRYYKIQRAI